MRSSFLILTALLTSLISIYGQGGQGRRVALVQSSFVWGDCAANISAFDSKIREIKGCDLIILPELFISGCDMQRRDKEVKDSVKRHVAAQYPLVIEQMQQWAKHSGAVVIGSTIYEEDSLFYNRLLAVYPSAQYLTYDKHNCFKKGAFSPGNDHLVITVNGHRYATYICYDLRFEEWSRNEGRYDSAIYIANWPESRSNDWDQLLSQRAAQNEATVIGVNCVGIDPSGVSFIGQSAIYNPDGTLHSKCNDREDQTLIVELNF
ncbi:MAG: nitrilase-related carbon-nitrogen hydrolase [Rikenellaceae bacterium]